MAKGLRRRGSVQDLEVGRSSWTISVNPDRNHRVLYKREAEGDLITEDRGDRTRDIGREDAVTGRVATSPGVRTASGSWKEQENEFSGAFRATAAWLEPPFGPSAALLRLLACRAVREKCALFSRH